MMSLSQLGVGEKAAIAKVDGDRRLARRLLSLGLRVGAEVEVLQWRSSGVVLASNNNRIALGDSLVSRLFIADSATA